MSQKNIFLLLGSNLGDRPFNLQQATTLIKSHIGNVSAISKIYETAAWGKTEQPNFLNQAIQLESMLSPTDLLLKILSIEKMMGRTRNEKWSERIIDIDIIYYGNEIIRSSNLTVPHPHLSERKFVLVPLVEISAEFVHPELRKTNEELLNECNDTLSVKEFTN